MKIYTPQQASEILLLAQDSQGLFERPWLDSVFNQLQVHALNLSWTPEEEEEFKSDEKVQNIISQIDEKDYYKVPSTTPRKLKSGRWSKKWSPTSRQKVYGDGTTK